MASDYVLRLISANENPESVGLGSDIFYKAAERMDVLEQTLCMVVRDVNSEFVTMPDDELIDTFVEINVALKSEGG